MSIHIYVGTHVTVVYVISMYCKVILSNPGKKGLEKRGPRKRAQEKKGPQFLEKGKKGGPVSFFVIFVYD